METLLTLPQQGMDQLTGWLAANPQLCGWFTMGVRFVFPVLALLILLRQIRSLLTVPCVPEVWAYLTLPNGVGEPLTHWETSWAAAAPATSPCPTPPFPGSTPP